jgi:hypothetical protein
MKTTIRSLALVLGMAVFFSACKKDKDDDAKGSFTANGQTRTTNYAINTGYKSSTTGEISYSDLFLATVDFTTTNYSGNVSGVGITFDNAAITPGTYTYKSDNELDFDPAKNFFDAYVAIDVPFPSNNGGAIIDDISTGTATITVDGDKFTINYDLDFHGNKVTGSYTGTAKQIIQD